MISLGLLAVFGSIVALNIHSMTSANIVPTSVTLEDNGRFLSLSVEGLESSSGLGAPFIVGAVVKRPRCSLGMLEHDDKPASELAVLTAEEEDVLGLGASSVGSFSTRLTVGQIDFQGVRKVRVPASSSFRASPRSTCPSSRASSAGCSPSSLPLPPLLSG